MPTSPQVPVYGNIPGCSALATSRSRAARWTRPSMASAVERFEVELPAREAITDVPDLYRTGPTEVLFATLALAIARVYSGERSGPRRLFVDLEGHSRDEGPSSTTSTCRAPSAGSPPSGPYRSKSP